MATQIGELQVGLKFNTKELSSSMKDVESTANNTASRFSKIWAAVGDSIVRDVAVKAFSSVTNAMLSFGKDAVKVGAEFDTAMSQVAATMGTTVDQIDNLAQTAMQMGATTSFTATEAAEGLNILAMAGLSAEEQIAGIPTVLNLAAAGATSMENAASYVVGAVNGFSDSMDNAAYYADLMAKGATLSNTSVAALGESLGRSAATAASYGQSADGVTLSLLKLASANVTGEAASTALNRAMADLYTPTDGAKEALAQLGISAYDSSGKARDFNEVVDELSGALSGMSEEEANALKSTIFTTQGLNAFNKMTTLSTATVEGFKNGLADATGSAAFQAATQLDNLEGKMTILSSALDGAKLQIYNGLKPALLAGADGLNGFAAALSAVLAGQDPSEAIGAFITNFGSALVQGLSQIGSVVGQVVPVILQAVVGILPALLQGLILAAVNLVQGLAAALPDIFSALTDALIGIIDILTSPDLLNMVLSAGIQLLTQLVNAIPIIIPKLMAAIPMIIDNILTFFITSAPTLLNAALQLFQAIIEAIPFIIQALATALPTIINAITNFLTEGDTVQLILNAAISAFMAIIEALPQIIEALAGALPDILTSIIEFLTSPGTIAMLLQAAITLFFALVQAVPQILGALIGAFGSLVGSLWESIKGMFGAFASNFGEFIGGIFRNAINGLLSFIENMINTPINLLNGFIDGINSVFGVVGVSLGHIDLIALPRMEYGGIVPGNSWTGDNELIRANSGEMVITRSQQAGLWDFIQGSLGSGEEETTPGGVAGTPITVNQTNYFEKELTEEQIEDLMSKSIRRAVA